MLTNYRNYHPKGNEMSQTNTYNKEAFTTLGLAALLITIAIFVLGGILQFTEGKDQGIIHTQAFADNDTTATVPALSDLTTTIATHGYELDENGVSAQYAVAEISAVSQQMWSKPLQGRVLCELEDGNWLGKRWAIDGLFWQITAEVEDGIIGAMVDAQSGEVLSSMFQATSFDVDWFDNWDVEAGNQPYSENMQSIVLNHDVYIPDDFEFINSDADMEDLAQRMENSDYLPRALEIAEVILSDSQIKPVSAKVVMAGTAVESFEMFYTVEVTLSDGTYLGIDLTRKDLQLRSFHKLTHNYATLLFN